MEPEHKNDPEDDEVRLETTVGGQDHESCRDDWDGESGKMSEEMEK